MSRATEDALDGLHALVAGALAEELAAARKRAEPKTLPDGTVEPGTPINPQLLDKVMKFLKDNGVDAPAKSPRMSNLLGELQDLDLDQEGSRLTN